MNTINFDVAKNMSNYKFKLNNSITEDTLWEYVLSDKKEDIINESLALLEFGTVSVELDVIDGEYVEYLMCIETKSGWETLKYIDVDVVQVENIERYMFDLLMKECIDEEINPNWEFDI